MHGSWVLDKQRPPSPPRRCHHPQGLSLRVKGEACWEFCKLWDVDPISKDI